MFVLEKEIKEIKTMRRLKIMENLLGEKKALTSSTKIANEIYPTALGNLSIVHPTVAGLTLYQCHSIWVS